MVRSGGTGLIRKLVLASGITLLWVAACGSDEADELERAGLSEGCVINTDCKSPLVCAFRRCHTQCEEQRDCPPDQLCIPADKPFNVCQLPDESECTHHSDCPESFRCAVDFKCRPECVTEKDCITGQQCIGGVCAADDELVDGGLVGDAAQDSSVGQPCVYASDCDGELACINGICLPECHADRDCPDGYTCNASQSCVPGAADGGLDASGPSMCANGAKDPGEDDIDCGPACGACAGTDCTKPSDCASHVCTSQKCQAPSCTDTLQNGTESDIDCGGLACSKCPAQKGCWSASDCNTGNCTAGICIDLTCSNNAKDGAETDTDCGGPLCNPCAVGEDCEANTDCTSGNCVSKKCVGPGPVTWHETYNGNAGARVATDPSGNVVFAGNFSGTQSFGAVQLTSSGSTDVFVAKYTPAGALLWAIRLGGASNEEVAGMGTDAAGNVLVAGVTSSSNPSLGGPAVQCNVGGLYVAKYAALNGAHVWSRCVDRTSGGFLDITTAAVDGSGDIYVAGAFYGAIDFGISQLVDVYLQNFIVKYASATGAPVWAREIAATGTSNVGGSPQAIAPVGSDAFLTGDFTATVGFGATNLTSAGSSDFYVVKVAGSDGALSSAKRFGDTAADHVHGMARTVSGKLVVTGAFTGQVDFGAGNVSNQGGLDAFLLELDPATMLPTWSKGFGSTAEDRGIAVASAQNGEIVLAAFMTGAANFGGGALTYAAGSDLVVARYAASGTHLSSNSWGGLNTDKPSGVAWAGPYVALAGEYSSGAIDFGDGNLPSGFSRFLVHFAP